MAEAVMQEWRAAVGNDLQLFALLHSAEPDENLLKLLKNNEFPGTLGLQLQQSDSRHALAFVSECMANLPTEVDAALLDELAVDFAAIYLNHTYRASPCESVWIDEESLMHQQPMFEIREWFERYDLVVENWRDRSDDHIVHQLQFLAHLCRLDDKPETLQQIALFMDAHILRWIQDFARQVQQHAETAYFAGIAVLTAAYLLELRDILGKVVDVPVVEAKTVKEPQQA